MADALPDRFFGLSFGSIQEICTRIGIHAFAKLHSDLTVYLFEIVLSSLEFFFGVVGGIQFGYPLVVIS
jgi:hypothetical protein